VKPSLSFTPLPKAMIGLMTVEQRPQLVQFGSLTAAHFAEHAVWAACNSFDYDEPWYDDTDEETFRPWRGALPVDAEIGMFLVRARFTTYDGMQLPGFITPTPTDRADEMGTVQPYVFLPSGELVGFWLGIMVERATEELSALTAELQREPSAIFPIQFAVDPGVATGLRFGAVDGFAGL
jgi:hypothetical protein